MDKLNMGSLLSRIAVKLTTYSNRRSSHAHPYCTQFSKSMRIFRLVEPGFIQTAAPAHAQPDGRAFSMRRHKNVGCAATAVYRNAGCFQHSRFSAHQPVEGKRCTERIVHQPSKLGSGSGRTRGLAQSPV